MKLDRKEPIGLGREALRNCKGDIKVTFTRYFLTLGKVTFDEHLNVLERSGKVTYQPHLPNFNGVLFSKLGGLILRSDYFMCHNQSWQSNI